MIPTPTELKYFIEVYQIRHLSNAALRLAVSQPTLTQSLQSLEKKVGTRLFHRTRQGTIPTEAGIRLYQRANALIHHWEDLQSSVRDSSTQLTGRFKLGCHESVGVYTLPRLLESIDGQAPGIELSLSHDLSRRITERVIAYELDLGIVVNPTRHPDLVMKKLGEDQFTFWKRKDLSRPPQKVFAHLELTQTQTLLKQTQAKVFKDWRVLGTGSFELIRAFTAQGLGVGVLPSRIARMDPSLVLAGSKLPAVRDEIFLVYRREALGSRAGKTLIELAPGILK